MVSRFMMVSAGFVLALAACGNQSAGIPVTLKDHQFTPAEIRVPANQPVLLTLTNHDSAAEEAVTPVTARFDGTEGAVVSPPPLVPSRPKKWMA